MPKTDLDLEQLAAWVVQTCLLFGTTHATAYLVAGEFLRGVEPAWKDEREHA